MNEANTLARLKAALAVARKCRKKAKHTSDLACYYFHDGEAHGLNAAIYAIQNGGSEPVTLPTPEPSTLASATGCAADRVYGRAGGRQPEPSDEASDKNIALQGLVVPTDTELLNWIEANPYENLDAIEWQLLHGKKKTVRESIAHHLARGL